MKKQLPSIPGIACVLLMLLFQHTVHAQATAPPFAPAGSYTNYFKYYTPGDTNMQAGANIASNAILQVNGYDYDTIQTAAGKQVDVQVQSGTTFLVRTLRKDGKICMCTAGHVVSEMKLQPGNRYSMEVYMKYLGKPNPQNPILNTVTRGYTATVHPELIDKLYSPSIWGQPGDWAVLLLDPTELPVRNFTTLGYLFDPEINSTTPPGNFLILGHPYSSPQRITGNLAYATSILRQYSASSPNFLLDNINGSVNGTATGTSGSPVINTWHTPAVTGIFWGGSNYDHLPIAENDIPQNDLKTRFAAPSSRHYSANGFHATKMSTPALMAVIKKHCWEKTDSASIELAGTYKQSQLIDNNQHCTAFEQSKSVTDPSCITTFRDQSYSIANPGADLLQASTLIISCALPDTGNRQIYGSAKLILLDTGFSYTAAGTHMLEMNTVVLEPVSPGTISAPGVTTGDTAGIALSIIPGSSAFQVYPNPSEDGVFYISFPESAAGGHLTLSSMEGKKIYKGNMGNTNPYKLDLSGLSKGTYVLNIYHPKTGAILFNKLIVYR